MPRQGPFLQLSREHHAALLLARDSARTDALDAEAVRVMNRRIADYWSAEMAAHFAHEERLLAQLPGALDADDHARLLLDHRDLRAACVLAADGGVQGADLHAFGRRLAAHVRFEERRCFPKLQAALLAVPKDPADA